MEFLLTNLNCQMLWFVDHLPIYPCKHLPIYACKCSPRLGLSARVGVYGITNAVDADVVKDAIAADAVDAPGDAIGWSTIKNEVLVSPSVWHTMLQVLFDLLVGPILLLVRYLILHGLLNLFPASLIFLGDAGLFSC